MLAALLLAAGAGPDPAARWQPLIEEAAARCTLPADWIARVLRRESGGDARALSPEGAMGLMQLMPATWSRMRVRLAFGVDAWQPRDNVIAGACYLRLMYDRFGYPGLFGAYNAGPERYAAWLQGTRGLPAETVAYLHAPGVDSPAPATPAPAPPALFALRGDAPMPAPGDAWAGLFAIRKDIP